MRMINDILSSNEKRAAEIILQDVKKLLENSEVLFAKRHFIRYFFLAAHVKIEDIISKLYNPAYNGLYKDFNLRHHYLDEALAESLYKDGE